MPSERIQRRIDAFLDQAEEASDRRDWPAVAELARAVLAIDADNQDAPALLRAAVANGASGTDPHHHRPVAEPERSASTSPALPASFVDGRYHVRRFLGEGGKKKVFLAHDESLDRDVAFALIKTEGLDSTGRQRIVREAQAMGRLGTHPHVVTIFEIGEEGGAPYVVTELMSGGDVEGLLKQADGALPLARTLAIAKDVARGLVFAHAHEVVHRDLKPGNVWLTADGTAKIGDFGLAVSLDRSRLTQHGMMVGTVAYMPPEQALGGETTPQADLYSLGAMLYEMVTGKPPFQADDPTAVISQHINTPPVAPSWRSEHCPPELEALILRCLAKVPADRPASAAEALAALARVDPDGRSASHSDSSANPLDRLARGVFVGRERELDRLRAAFDAAFAGRGSVVMLVGEPGIGKTRTSLELETYARMRGARVIWGRAHEAAGAPAYRPWVQAADTYASTYGLDTITPQLATDDQAELSRIFPDLRRQPGYAPPIERVDPAEARFRLFDAYTKLVRALASEAPLVVVLDDLHWADHPTLLLLQHVARELARLRVLVVGTYRDTELSRTHPLSGALAELSREGALERINLDGLGRNDVADYIRSTTGVEPSRALVDRVYEETEGNPFFLSEVVNLMTEEGKLASDSVSDIAIPEGVRQALGRRLDRLSEQANALLQYAAVAGREFAYDTLRLLTDHDDDTLLRLVEEGLAARVIAERAQPGRYQFTHALMQETLLDELSTTRRVRMHGAVAGALERRYGDRADDQPARLAMHYLESATLNADHARKAVHYAALAGREAEARYAWDEAARLYQRATTLLDDTTDVAFDADRHDLYAALARSANAAGEFRLAWRALMIAVDGYRARGDGVGMAQISTLPSLNIWAPSARLAPVLLEALDLIGDRLNELDLELLSEITSALHWPYVRPFVPDSAVETVTACSRHRVDVESASDAARNNMQLVEFFAALRSGDLQHAVEAARSTPQATNAELIAGELGAARVAAESQLAQPWLSRLFQDSQRVALGSVALLRADYAAFDAVVASADSGNFWYDGLRAARALVSGHLESAERSLPDPSKAGGVPHVLTVIHAVRCGVLWQAGRHAEAGSDFRHALDAAEASGYPSLRAGAGLSPADVESTHGPFMFEVAAAHFAEGAEREALEVIVRSQPGVTAARTMQWPASVQRVYGEWALVLGMDDDAERLFADALGWCERERCPIEAGRCNQGLAELAERRGDHALAMEHLDRAGELFSRHGAKLYLDQVLAKKQILKA